MNQTDTYTDPTSNGATQAATEIAGERSARSAPRRWWRAFDQLTLATMNPPVPAHVRAALYNPSGVVRPNASTSIDGGRPANQNLISGSTNGGTPMTSETTTFAAAIRTAAPGRSERVERLDKLANAAFARAIRAAAPGRTAR